MTGEAQVRRDVTTSKYGYGQGIWARDIARQIRSLFAHHAAHSAKSQALAAVLVQIQRITAWVLSLSSSPITDASQKDSPRSQARCHDILPHSGHHAHWAEPGCFTSSYEYGVWFATDTGILHLAPKSSMYRIQPGILIWKMEMESWTCYGELDNTHTYIVGSDIGYRDYLCLIRGYL